MENGSLNDKKGRGELSIAIDGPSGAGKSTIAKLVARRLGLEYVDTGAMYRALAYKMCEENVGVEDKEALSALLESCDIDFSGGKVLLDGRDISGGIRTEKISKLASDVSAMPPVRLKLTDTQRKIGMSRGVVMDGRDIGTVVLKDIAKLKIFLTASPEERARRRWKELKARGEEKSFEAVFEDINRRDYNDSHREFRPLKKAEDAIEIDSTDMDIESVAERITALAEPFIREGGEAGRAVICGDTGCAVI